MAASLLGTEVPLGLIPVGTANVLAYEIGLLPHAGAIVDMLLNGS